MKMEQTVCSETSAHKFQTPGNHPKESIQQQVLHTLAYELAAFVNQHEKRMLRTIICGLSDSTAFFQIIPQTVLFSENKLFNAKYVFWFSLQLLSETFLILRINQWDINTHVHGSSCKVPVILVRFQLPWILSTDFRKCSNIKFHENPSNGNRIDP